MNISILINIHHVDLALDFADRVIGIRAGEIVFDGPVKDVSKDVLDSIYSGKEIPQLPKDGKLVKPVAETKKRIGTQEIPL